MSTLRHAAGRASVAFILAAAMAVAGYAAFAGPGATFAQEDPPAPTATPQGNSPDADVIVPATDEGAAEEMAILPTPDDSTEVREQAAEEASGNTSDEGPIAPAPDAGEGEGLIAPAPDKGVEEREQAAEDTSEDASGEMLIAPAPDSGEGEGLIAPAANGEAGDGNSWWVYGLLAGAGLVAVAGALAWRLRPHKA